METPESIRASLIPGEWVLCQTCQTHTSSFPSSKLKEVPDTVLSVDNKSGEVQTQPTQVFPFVGYEFHLHLALVNPLVGGRLDQRSINRRCHGTIAFGP